MRYFSQFCFKEFETAALFFFFFFIFDKAVPKLELSTFFPEKIK